MLRIEEVHKHFGGVHALDDVSLQVGEGEVVALVGSNGAGKSTLMKCVSGVHCPDSGVISFDKNDLSQGSPEAARAAGIEMVYQDLSLCDLQDVVTNVFLGREEKKGLFLDRAVMRSRCSQVFADLGTGLPLESLVGTLSGGQKQAVAIARAMISDPKLLILDEPTAALSAKEVQKVLELITGLKQKGISVVMITHRLGDLFEVADRIVLMAHGAIREELSPAETDVKDLTSKIIGE